ncbi:MAG: FIST N-terminal domain-containing protein [Halodesulfovibrio sp.]
MTAISVRTAMSVAADAHTAVSEIAQGVTQPGMSVVIFFTSVRFDLPELGRSLQQAFDCPVIGCTTAGEFVSGMGYRNGSIVAASISSQELAVRPVLVEDITKFSGEQAERLVSGLVANPSAQENASGKFALLMIDGLAGAEEQVIYSLQKAFGSIPVVGGSAGDDFNWRETFVYHGGAFHSGAALLTLIETSLPFAVLQTQHFMRSEDRFEITSADPETRTVYTINNRPAAAVYAEAVGVPENKLTPARVSLHPLILWLGGQHYVRSVREALPDGSMTFNSAVEQGLVLYLGTSHDIVANLEHALDDSLVQIPYPKLLIGFECAHRRLEVEELGLTKSMQQVLDRMENIGFHTYGEQVDSLHVNQTFAGVIIGDHA